MGTLNASVSPGLGAAAGATAGAFGFMETRGLREGTGDMWRFSENIKESKHQPGILPKPPPIKSSQY